MAPLHTPPTKILSDTPLSPTQAHAFLTAFTTAAEISKNDAHNGHNEIVLANLKRIEQALIGIHVPRPVQGDLDIEGVTDMAVAIVEETTPVEGDEEERGENSEGDTDALDEGHGKGQKKNIPVVQTVVKKADKKADKKARRKEEKRQRAEQRKKEKEADDTMDDDSE